ncbi:MAG TPA: aromatic ring-hydroxylating dioxygenase subunit alpha [Stellaceae bacterium]|nr:aromatic ring-hydroxylating dioxygenase subunit alpha [Stellaceae bacterium]
MDYLRNTWYVAAWGEEVTRNLLPRTILEEPIVFYRKEDGSAVAIGGVCPHRFAPLHIGHLIGDNVQCIYHGLQFDASGKCAFSPIDKKIPAAAKVKSYPLAERWGLIWIWMGVGTRADESLIPDFSYLVDPKRRVLPGRIHVAANYELIIDNLADLTHPHFVHNNFMHTETIPETQNEIRQDGKTVHTNFLFPNGKVPQSYGRFMDDMDLIVDRWVDIRWDAPGLIRLDAGCTPTGRPRAAGVQTYGTHLLTPETGASTHYFFAHARGFKLDDPETDAHVREWQRVAFSEQDKPVIEAQQKVLGDRDLMSMKPVLLSCDGGAVRIRRVMKQMIEAEKSAGTAHLAEAV